MLFIDTNSYLEFFKSSQPSLQKLLPALLEVRDEIFITHQVVSEIQRNKVRITADLLRKFAEGYKPVSIRLPAHLDPPNDPKIAAWNTVTATLHADISKNAKALDALISNILTLVSESRDCVSVELNQIFASARSPSHETLSKARARKELGNAPGKPGDPIGDQLSWEMILDGVKPGEIIWLVTLDQDYATLFNGKRFLNAQLMNELQAKLGTAPTVHLFDSIATALTHFSANRAAPIKSLPSEIELKEIAREEAALKQFLPKNLLWPDPTTCQHCGSPIAFDAGPVPKPSRYGSWTYQWFCKSCGKWSDYGEPYDD